MFGRRRDRGHQPRKYARLDGPGTYRFDIVGESHYQKALSDICGGKTQSGHRLECVAYLVPEPGNPHDKNAIAVHINDEKVGHLPRAHAAEFARVLDGRVVTVDALIVGGWRRGKGDEGSFGVKLDL